MQDSQRTGGRQDVEFCESRGFHGPSFYTEAFDRKSGWEGFGVCLTCGSTRFVPTEVERHRTSQVQAPEGSRTSVRRSASPSR